MPTYDEIKLVAKKPAQVDQLWDLRSSEEQLLSFSGKKARKKWRRGSGATKLHLSMAAARRGERKNLVSAVTGNVIFKLTIPKFERKMPELKIVFGVSTMDTKGNVEWCKGYAAPTATALTKRIKHHLSTMMNDIEYPTLACIMEAAVSRATNLPALALPAPQ